MSREFKFVSKHKPEKIKFFSGHEIGAGVHGVHSEIFSDRELVLEGCRGVADYKENYIKLKLVSGSLIVCGENFDIARFENDTITVRGKINSLEFCV